MYYGRLLLEMRDVSHVDEELLMTGVTAHYDDDEFIEAAVPLDTLNGVAYHDRHTGLTIVELIDGRKWLVKIPFYEFIHSEDHGDDPVVEIKEGKMVRILG